MIRKDLITRIDRESPGNSDSPSKISFTASTNTADRYGDIVAQNWELEAYRANPVVLLNHDQFSLPIGRGSVGINENELVIDVEFDMDDPRASEVARKAKSGFMNAVSVGFRPLASVPRSELPPDHYAYGQKGAFFERSELLEVSVVTIPANPDATARLFQEQKDLEDLLRTVVRQELTKHIIQVSETEEAILISFKKAQPEPDEVEEAYEEEDEDTEEEYDPEYQNEFVKALCETSRKTSPAVCSEGLTSDEKDFYNHLISIGDEYE